METIRLKLFARFAEAFGANEISLRPAVLQSALDALREELSRLRPELAKLVTVSAFAVNEEYAAPTVARRPMRATRWRSSRRWRPG